MPFFGYSSLFLSRALFEGTFHNFYRGYSASIYMSGYFPVLTAAVFGSFFRSILNWFTTMNQKTELDKQKLVMELDLLKSKINPEEASASLIRLSDMMRYLTYETSEEVVELGKEVSYIENLIELYRISIKTPEDIIFEVKGNMKVKIAPALFVPLIENGSFRIRSAKS